MDEVRHHFGVSVRGENITRRFEFCAHFIVVFDNAIVHQTNIKTTSVRLHRVCVTQGRRAVGCPTGVGNADVRAKILSKDLRFELRHTLK